MFNAVIGASRRKMYAYELIRGSQRIDGMNDKIDIELAEDEDLARAKAWWKENGSSIIGGVVIGTCLVLGYNFWQSYQEDLAREVAQLYEQYALAPQ